MKAIARTFASAMISASWLACSACAGPAKNYKFPQRKYDSGEYDVDGSVENGLLWGENTASVVEDNRSAHLGDIVVVRIEESADATEAADTSTSTSSSVQAGIQNFFGIVENWAAKHPNVDESALIRALMNNSFQGNGSTNRSGSLNATITCQVKRVLPNGDLFIEGGKTLQVNAEESHLYLSGVVRPYDISMDNTVSSLRVLDARIDFSGRGVVSDKQRPGILHRGVDTLWPF